MVLILQQLCIMELTDFQCLPHKPRRYSLHHPCCIYVDELHDILTFSSFGIPFGGVYHGAPVYADNLVLLKDSPEALLAMLNIARNYTIKWRYTSLFQSQ